MKFVVCFLGGLVGRKQKIGGMLKGELSVLGEWACCFLLKQCDKMTTCEMT